MDTKQIVIFSLAAIAAGGAAYALAYPWLNDDRAEKRQKSIYDGRAIRNPVNPRETALRRGQVAESLKDLERRQKNLRNPPLTVCLEQAGLTWTPKRFYLASVAFGILLSLVLLVMTSWYVAAIGLFVGIFGLPRWLLKQMTKRRQ